MTLTPGSYIALRRGAAGFSIAEVAARLDADPHVDERARAEWLTLIERGEQPASLATIVALKRVFSFDLDTLIVLERIAQGSIETSPRLCRVCGCGNADPCIVADWTCGWVGTDLCSACLDANGDVIDPPRIAA